MSNYNGLTRNQWPGTWSPSSNHPIALDTEIRGGLRYVSGVDSDTVTGIHGQRLQDGMVVYVKNAHGGFEADRYYKYQLGAGEYRDSNTGELPNAAGNWAPFQLDSAATIALIDSSYIQARVDSVGTATLATNAENLGGQPPSYYTDWNNVTNPPAILDTVDVSNIIVNDVDKTFVDGLGINADQLDGLDRQQFLRADQSDSMVGSLHIDSNLVIGGYIAGPEIFYIDPNTVGDNTGKVVIKGNLQVDGTQTIVNSTTVTINDKNLVLADSAADSAEADGAGITVNGSNATITYNATSDKWEFNKDIAAGNINATVTGTFTGFDSDFDARLATKTTTDVAEGTNLYYTTARHDSDTLAQVDSSYVQSRQTPQDFAYSSLTGAPTNVSSFVNDANYLDSTTVQGVVTANYIDGLVNLNYLDSAEAIQLFDSAYVQARQDYAYSSLTGTPTNVSSFANDANYLDSTTVTGVIDQTYVRGHIDAPYVQTLIDATYLDSAEAIALIDSDYVRARQITYDFLDSAEVIQLIDSAYVQAREGSKTFGLAGNTGTHTFDPTTETLTFLGTTGQINAGIAANNVTLELDQNINSITSIAFEGTSSNNNETKIQAIDPTADNTINLPDSSGTVALVETIDSAYVQARTPQIDLSAVDQHIVPASGSLYDLGDSNYFWRDLYLSGSTIVLGDLKLSQHTGRLRITNRHNGAEIKLAAENIGNHKIDSSVVTSLASATASALPVSTFANDANYLDSVTVKAVIDSGYIATAMETDSNITVTIVQNITDTVDSAYVLGRVAEAPFLDSANAIQLIDSTYVQARQTPQDFAYSSLTGAPTNVSAFVNDANYLDSTTIQALLPSFGNDFVDSATVINIINSEGLDSDLVIALVDSAYIQLRDRFQDSSLVTSTVDATYVQARQIKYNTSDFLDSNTVSLVVDSAYIAARTTAGTDSAAIINLIDSDYVNARVSGADSAINASEAINADQLDRQHGSYYLDYNNFTNTPSTPPTIDKAYVDALNVDADTLDGQNGTYYLDYSNLTNKPTVLTTTDVKNVFNSSGDDEISTGAVVDAKYLEFPHDGGSQHEFLVEVVSKTSAHRYQGSGSSNGYQIDGVESPFLQLVPGNTYRFNQSNGTNGSHQLRFYYDAARTTAYTSGVSYNGVAGNSGAYTQIVISESTPPVLYYQCVNHGYMGNAVFTQTRNLTGFTTDDLTQGSTNLYYDSSTTTAIIDSDYIQTRTRIGLDDIDFGSNKILYSNVYSQTSDLPNASSYHGMFAHVHATGKGYFAHGGNWIELANASDVFNGNYNSLSNKPSLDFLDSALAIQLIDSAYVQARQTTVGSGSGGIDSAAVINLVDSAYVTARYTGAGITLGTARAGLSVITGAASGGGALSYDNSTGEFTFNPSTNTGGGGGSTSGTADGITLTKFVYTADSGQLAFTDSDDTGDVLAYNTADTQINVYLNGILLVDSDDFTLTDSSTVTLTSAAALNDVVQIIKYTPPSASSGGGGTGTVDSADIEIIVDSNYVQNRMGSLAQGTLDVNKYFFDASANQSVFTGNDKFGNLFSVDPLRTEVYLNGVLQELTTDYSITASQVNLTDAADSGYSLTVIETIGRVNTHQSMVETVYEFDADSGQTTFTGVDRGGINTLAMADGIVSVFINGILISETNDYTTTSDTLTLLDAADSGDFVSVKVTSGVVASTLNTDQYTFTGQTSKTLTGGGLGFTGNVQIFKNGSILKQSEFAVSNGDTITLVDSAISSDVFVVQTFNAQEFAAKTFDYIADSGQTIFSGADRHGEILRYQEAGCIVYLNGIALVDSSDYVTTNNGTITFNDPVDVNDEVKIYTFIPANLSSIAAPLEFSQFEYTASANQTLFSGADSNGNTLSYDSDKISVYLNGLLLRTEDYTATNGTSVTLSVAADDGDNLTVAKLTGNNIGLDRAEVQAIVDASASNTTWTEVVSPVTVIGGSRNIVDTSAGAITLTLPAVAGIGTEVRVIDGTGNASTNNITIARNGHKIQGGTSNLVIDIDRAGIGLVYYNTAQGWILIEN